MYDEHEEPDARLGPEDRRLNILQLLAISFVLGSGAGAMAWLTGFGLGGVLLVAWGGTIAGAMGVTALLVVADSLLSGSRLRSEATAGEDTLGALIEAWDDDLVQDLAESEADDVAHADGTDEIGGQNTSAGAG